MRLGHVLYPQPPAKYPVRVHVPLRGTMWASSPTGGSIVLVSPVGIARVVARLRYAITGSGP